MQRARSVYNDSTAFVEYLIGPVVNGRTSTPHGYTNGSFVEIQDATGPEEDLFEHTFPVSALSSTDFSFEVIAAEGDDIPGATTCRKVAYPIDAIMASLPSHSIVLFGTGVFETRGVAAWGCKVAQKLRGSGMDATALKLVSVGIRSGHNLGSQFYDVPLNYVEVCVRVRSSKGQRKAFRQRFVSAEIDHTAATKPREGSHQVNAALVDAAVWFPIRVRPHVAVYREIDAFGLLKRWDQRGSHCSILIDTDLLQIVSSDDRLVRDNRVTSAGVRYNMRTSGEAARGWDVPGARQRDNISDNVMDALSLAF